MVAFTYSRTGSAQQIQQQVQSVADNAAGLDSAASADTLANTQRQIQDTTRQLEMAYQGAVINREQYQTASQQLSVSNQQTRSIDLGQQSARQQQTSDAANQTADRDLRSAPASRPFSYTSEDFTARTSEEAEAAARENARAQAAVNFGANNYNINHYDTRVRLLPNGQYSAYTLAHGFGQDEAPPNIPVTEDEDRRIVRPFVPTEDGYTITPTLKDPDAVAIDDLLPPSIVVQVPDRRQGKCVRGWRVLPASRA